MRKQERKKRKSTQLDGMLKYVIADLEKLDNQELRTFKAAILLEYLLVFILAKRLNVEDDDLPNLDYVDLTILAVSGSAHESVREQVLKLGEVRNYLGHYLDRDAWLQKVREFVALFGLPVPEREDLLLLVYDLALSDSYIELFLVAAKVASVDIAELEKFVSEKRRNEKRILDLVIQGSGAR